MKEKFIEAGLRVAKGKKIANLKEALEFCNEVGYPIVAKPDMGVGAQATYKLENQEDIKMVDFKYGYFFEEFIQGKIVTFDGLVDIKGNLVFYTSHEYSTGIMEIANENLHIYYYSVREIPADLEEVGRKAIKAFNVRERFFHFEFFRTTKDNSLVCLEVNIRPPGGFTLDMFNYANDIDLYEIWSELITSDGELETPIKYSRPSHVCYISRKKHIKYKNTHEEVLNNPTFAKKNCISWNSSKGPSIDGGFILYVQISKHSRCQCVYSICLGRTNSKAHRNNNEIIFWNPEYIIHIKIHNIIKYLQYAQILF